LRCDLSDAEAAKVLDTVFRGRPNGALAYLDSLEARSGGEPFFLIMRARCYQEFIPMDDDSKAVGRERSRPALADLDRCTEICTRRIESGDADDRIYFLRGWAWMAKAYVRSMTKDLYGAGHDAKRGKSDLETYLSTHPDDPTAKGMLGAFLYFADTIPGAFKLISKLLLLPSGDREKGIEYLQTAAQAGGLLETDWKLILFNVYFYFEGRFEEALTGLKEMLRNYPEYARTAIPLSISRLYAPQLNLTTDELVEDTVNRMYSAPPREVDWNALYIIQLFRAVGDRYCNHTSTTVARLRSIVHESPDRPDWIVAFSRLELGRLYAARGDRDGAVALFESVAKGYTFDYLRKDAETLLDDVAEFGDAFSGPAPPDLDPWVSALYRSGADSIPSIRAHFAELAPGSIAARFYTGECYLLAGDFDRALKCFNEVISEERPAWEHGFQMIASTRMAEIYASLGSYKTAARYQDIALSYYHNEYLIDWVMEGRKRYFEQLAEGKVSRPPTLLFANGLARNPADNGGPKGAGRKQHD
jgi:tetratricopeptide (TPR) repeat protein